MKIPKIIDKRVFLVHKLYLDLNTMKKSLTIFLLAFMTPSLVFGKGQASLRKNSHVSEYEDGASDVQDSSFENFIFILERTLAFAAFAKILWSQRHFLMHERPLAQ
jgi:hypothetical protein